MSGYSAFEKAKEYTKVYTLEAGDEFVVKQEDGYLGYASAGQIATTGSNIFIGGQIIDGNITVTGDIYASNLVTSSTLIFTGSTNHGTSIQNTHTFTGSMFITGSETISGSLFISGTTELGGNIVPKTARGATLGTVDRPFSDIFVSSGSINIASDTPGAPNTNLSNISGNILISAGGMRLSGSAAFIAATGSFQYISGSMTQVGDYSQTGNYTMVGNKTITGSLNVSGSIALTGSLKLDATSNIQYTPRLVSGTIGVVTIDFSKDSIIHAHTTGSTINITGSNLTPGRVVDVIIHNDVGGTSQINHGVSSTNASNGSSFYLATKQLAFLRYYCLVADGGTNLFVTAIIS